MAFKTKQIFSEPEELIETKIIVHGYLGNKASREMEQFFSEGELKRIAHYEKGIWIAPTRGTFKSYLPDIFPERPYIVHQNSPLAWSILMYIHSKQDEIWLIELQQTFIVRRIHYIWRVSSTE